MQFQSPEDSLRFEVEEDLKSGDPSQGVQGLSLREAGLGPLVEVPEGKDCKGKVGEGKEKEQVDYGSSPEWEALEGGLVCPQLRLEVHVIQHDDTSSNEVYFLILHLFWFIFLFVDFFARPCLFSSFVASDTNGVE